MMHLPLFDRLKNLRDRALKSGSADEKIRNLSDAFSLFSHETSKLEKNFLTLQQKLNHLTNEQERSEFLIEEKEKKLKAQGRFLHALLSSIEEGAIYINKAGIITLCNEKVEKLLGIERKDLIKKNYWDVFGEDFFGFSMNAALLLQAERKSDFYASKTQKKLFVTGKYLQNSSDYQGYLLIIEEKEESQKELLSKWQMGKMEKLGKTTASLIHEIRNPLGGIRGYASLLSRDLESSPHLQGMANQILEGIKILERLVHSVLEYARPIHLSCEKTQLQGLVKEISSFCKMDPAFPKEVDLDIHLSSEPIYAKVDSEYFRTCLLNLVMNAYQAIEGKGLITISLFQQNEKVYITISDTGKGIKQEELDQLFHPFFTTKEKGTGLGLSSTYEIIKSHGGHIEARSQVGYGTTFTITLPVMR